MSILQTAFTSNQNADYIISNVINNVLKICQCTIKKDQIFFKAFNNVASSIFKVESQNNNKDLADINSIVISELTKYITDNINTFPRDYTVTTTQPTKPVQLTSQLHQRLQPQALFPQTGFLPTAATPIPIPTILTPKESALKSVDIPIKKETFRINIDKDFKLFPVKNVLSIKLISLFIMNTDYTVTELNNKLVFREHINTVGQEKKLYSENFEINLEPGDYTPTALLEELQYQMTALSDTNYTCLLDPVSQKTVITSGENIDTQFPLRNVNATQEGKKFDIIANLSTLLPILGFKDNKLLDSDKYISQNRIKLIRSPSINLTVSVDTDTDTAEVTNSSTSTTKIFDEPLMIDNTSGVIHFKDNIQKIFNKNSETNIQGFTVNFGNYNRRGHDFSLILEIECREVI
jgi:hypothetical protein